ncbi:alpha/beta fold hydrolase [Aspergillus foveolatus]|uniref:alpha/beta fold hydrolase n=1 Tax=Aspergillus foveolatus TaxID=210207 RepID=UPI003CCD85E6
MAVDKTRVSGDSRVEHRSAFVKGKTYGYLHSQPPSGQYKGTVVLLHGFPDLSMGWRYQIPLFVNKGYRVIAPDCLGYGRTDAPADLAAYSHKNCADDIKELANQLGASKIILGGHDWGAFLAYRVALWHPTLITHLFTVCVPYSPPYKKYMTLEDMVSKVAPHFRYQLHFVSGEIEEAVKSKEDHKQFLISLYGGKTQEKMPAFDVHKGVDLEKMRSVKMSWLLEEEEMEYYAWEFARHGLRGPLNWYRTRKINYDDELSLQKGTIDIPVLFIQALKDAALPPHLGKGMGKAIPQLTTKQVNASHWALWEKPAEVNQALEAWFNEVVEGGSRVTKL